MQTLHKYFLSSSNFLDGLKKSISVHMHKLNCILSNLFLFIFYVRSDCCFLIKHYSLILIMSDSSIIHCKEYWSKSPEL